MDPLRHVKPAVRSLAAYALTLREAPVKINQNENPWDLPEAVKRRVPVTLCKSDGAVCIDDASPFRRWIVFVDDANPAVSVNTDGNGIRDGGEAILKDRTVSDTLNAPATGHAAVYLPSGRIQS